MELLAHTFGLSFLFGILLALLLKTRVRMKRICIVVLGDIGRSPRMQYHAKSFLLEGYDVELVGYPGSNPLQELRNSQQLKIHYLQSPPNFENYLPRIISYIVKVLWQSINLAFVLFTKCSASYLFLQNPPAIPTIPVCYFWCRMQKKEFMIDWHNYAFSIMALNHRKNSLIVRLAMFIESYFGAKADRNFCVTNAMREDLETKWGIKAKVLYDRPPNEFHPISIKETHELLLKMKKDYKAFEGSEEDSTMLTRISSNNEIELIENRSALLISSTSWTEDEDFSVLIDALNEYDSASKDKDLKLPNMVCVITGKGPLKKFYTEIIKNKNWKHVTVITPWLENEDYPKLLASADLGVCLHTSSSGLDLPMKVVDMFGCGLPVCAYKFNCLHELVKHNENSLVFSNAAELAEQLKSWFKNFPNDIEQQQKFKRFKTHLADFQQLRWHGNWTNEVLSCFDH